MTITNKPIVYIGVKHCPYTINGTNLAEMRRARLRKVAKAIRVSADGSKQDLLKRIIGSLAASQAPNELKDL